MAGGGGAWKVAYADFVTAMMAFFLVMWIVAQNKSVKEAVSGYFRDPFGKDEKPAGSGLEPGYIARSKVKAIEKGRGKGAGPAPKLIVIREMHGTSIGASILFPEDSAELDATAKHRLEDVVPLVLGKQNKIEIRAHTARKPQKPGESMLHDWRVCFERGEAVMKFFESYGVESKRLRVSLAGPYEPAIDVKNDLWRSRNSRVDIYMLDEYFDDREGEEPATVSADEPTDETSGH
jgi:chemotaxis protein MotB